MRKFILMNKKKIKTQKVKIQVIVVQKMIQIWNNLQIWNNHVMMKIQMHNQIVNMKMLN